MVFWRQNHVTFIFIEMMSHDLLVQMAYFTTCFRHYDILLKTHSGMTTAIRFSPPKWRFLMREHYLLLRK